MHDDAATLRRAPPRRRGALPRFERDHTNAPRRQRRSRSAFQISILRQRQRQRQPQSIYFVLVELYKVFLGDSSHGTPQPLLSKEQQMLRARVLRALLRLDASLARPRARAGSRRGSAAVSSGATPADRRGGIPCGARVCRDRSAPPGRVARRGQLDAAPQLQPLGAGLPRRRATRAGRAHSHPRVALPGGALLHIRDGS